MPPQEFFSSSSREWEELSFQTKFLAIGSSLGHLSMKKFQIGPIILALRLDKGRVLQPSPPLIEQNLTCFSDNEVDNQS